MKKILLFTNLILISTIYFQNCVMPKQVIGPLEGTNKNWHCMNYNDSVYHGIPFSISETLFNQYSSTQYAKITAGPAGLVDDSRSVWFSLDVLKKFIYKIEDTLYRKNCDPNTRLGMRFYFATYPDAARMLESDYLKALPASYANHHTLFMVPTFDSSVSGNIFHYDFNAFKDINAAGKLTPAILRRQKESSDWSTTPTLILGVTSETYMQNHGEVGPPPSPVEGATFH